MTMNIPYELTLVTTTKLYRLGATFTRPHPTADYGEQTWDYVYNDEAATAFAAGNVIVRDAGTVTTDGILSPAAHTPRSRVIGVAQHAIAAGSYGWILQKGIGEVLAGTETIDVDEPIACSPTDAGTAAECGSYATNAAVLDAHIFHIGAFGWATENAAAAALATCWINCQG